MKHVISAGQSARILFDDRQHDDQELIFELEQESSLELALILTGLVPQLSITVSLVGARAQAHIKGVYIVSGIAQVQLTTHQIHSAPDGTSSCVIKGILYDSSSVQYTGTVYAGAQAHHTVAQQVNKNILLSALARAQSIPSLEVLTKKVHCSHGSAVGALDAEQLVYMQSRGISEHDARRLLLKGFVEDVVQVLPHEQKTILYERIR